MSQSGEVIETQCDHKNKPTNKLECYMGTCPRWIAEDWGEVGDAGTAQNITPVLTVIKEI